MHVSELTLATSIILMRLLMSAPTQPLAPSSVAAHLHTIMVSVDVDCILPIIIRTAACQVQMMLIWRNNWHTFGPRLQLAARGPYLA